MRHRLPVLLVLTAIALGAAPADAEVAEYRVSFDATWSNATHGPGAWPVGGHFSPPVGNTHDASVSFWASGSLASNGIEAMAELGAASTFNTETQTAISAGTAFSSISASGFDSPGASVTTFLIRSSHPLATLVSMVAPSPDWFVGVSGLTLHNGSVWLDDVVVDLFVYDAGTDNGSDFTSSNSDTNPADPISLLGAPFTGAPRLGTLTFEFLRIVAECEDTLDNDDDGLTDLADPGCVNANDPSEFGLVACDDGVDNDGDLLIDFPEDDGCSSLTDASEVANSPLGLVPSLPWSGLLVLTIAFLAIGT